MACCEKCKNNEFYCAINDSFSFVDVTVKRIIFNDPATVVFWADGTKTIVKAREGDEFNPYYGFLAALAKKIYGSNTKVQSIVNKWAGKEEEELTPKERLERARMKVPVNVMWPPEEKLAADIDEKKEEKPDKEEEKKEPSLYDLFDLIFGGKFR